MPLGLHSSIWNRFGWRTELLVGCAVILYARPVVLPGPRNTALTPAPRKQNGLHGPIVYQPSTVDHAIITHEPASQPLLSGSGREHARVPRQASAILDYS